jgi:ABC transport system ATP-binding/permease protein
MRGIVPFASFAQCEVWRAQQMEAEKAATTRGRDGGGAGKSARRKLSYGEQREYDAIEETLSRAEAALAEATAETERPEHASDAGRLIELIAAVTARQEDIDRLYTRWAELEAKLAGNK